MVKMRREGERVPRIHWLRKEKKNSHGGGGDCHGPLGCAKRSVEEPVDPHMPACPLPIRFASPCSRVGGKQVAGVKGTESPRVFMSLSLRGKG